MLTQKFESRMNYYQTKKSKLIYTFLGIESDVNFLTKKSFSELTTIGKQHLHQM